MKQFLVLLIVLGLVACKSTEQVQVSPLEHLHDDAFPDFEIHKIETQEEIFALDREAREFVARAMRPQDTPVEQIRNLAHNIFDHSDFNLLYMGAANTTATETFHNRAANCLSLSIMTYAMAKEAGFSVRFQDIKIPEYWTRRNGFSLLNGHINLKIVPREESHIIRLFEKGYEVDFDPLAGRKNFPREWVSKETVLAMFYNNKGADALLANSFSEAYAYFRQAVEADPMFDSTWVNLGFLYRVSGHYEYAEGSYEQALVLDNNNLTAWENLAYLYDITGRTAESDSIMAIVESKRADNPFYHFILGEQEFENRNWGEALQHYRNALRLDKSRHEIYYGLAKTYFQLGEVKRSKRYFQKAKQRSRTDQDQARYQGKLDLLTRS